jgi:hypothetical protein
MGMNSFLAGVVTVLLSASVEEKSLTDILVGLLASIAGIIAIFILAAWLGRRGRKALFQANIPSDAAIEQMFADMKNKSGWNTDRDLVWSYFFFDSRREKLSPLAEHLVKMGYRVVTIDEPERDENGDGGFYMLEVDRVETHTPASLIERNAELSALGWEFGVESYDGMEAAPVLEHKND